MRPLRRAALGGLALSIFTLLWLAVGLSMDAFAVSISSGILLCRSRLGQTLKIAGAFGLFQGLMPLVGYTIARLFAVQIQAFDHWIAFGLLAFIGGKMLWEVFRGGDSEPHGDPCRWQNLLMMAIATSIDAMAVGVSLALMPHTGMLSGSYGYLLCCGIIALVTFLLCAVGVKIGCRTGDRFGRKAEIAGGVMLILIGLKILLEHLFGL